MVCFRSPPNESARFSGFAVLCARLLFSARAFAWLIVIAELCQSGTATAADAPSPDHVAFFEKEIRPILIARCFECHAGEVKKGDVLLDSREALVKEGDAGPVLVPGKPDESRLLEVLTHTDAVKMPPAGKLPVDEIAKLTEWVRQGAVFPKSATGGTFGPATPEGIAAARKTHWAYQPVVMPAVPAVKDTAWALTEIDRFVLAKLEAAGLEPQPQVDRPTLLRRLSFDLLGLPPDLNDAEVQTFLRDDSPAAVERLVDHLLDDPAYGERWGRHWLDVARYADTKGYVFTEERKYPYSYTYRDYVVDAFNRDLPYDRFVREQLAADRLPAEQLAAEHNRPLAGLGFLTVGRRFSNNIHDIIDDRIDVVTRGFLGMSVTCARCHDHKYDPLPTADYYSLYAIFNSSEEPGELPSLGEPKQSAEFDAFQKQLAEREGDLARHTDELRSKLIEKYTGEAREYLVDAVCKIVKQPYPTDKGLSLKPEETRDVVVNRWIQLLNSSNDPNHPVWGPLARYRAIMKERFDDEKGNVTDTIKGLAIEGEKRVNPRVRALFETVPASMVEVALRYGEVLRAVHEEWRNTLKNAPADKQPTALSDPAAEELRQVLYAENAPPRFTKDELPRIVNRDERNKIRDRQKKIDALKATSPGAPPRAMVLVDRPNPTNVRIFKRGNPGNQGDEVPRRGLRVLYETDAPVFNEGSGRRELAELITSPTNPLTSRVIVNRVWAQHFGNGLVRTTSDFGIRGERPSHPELLDHLAATFVADGWSLKRLHRRILTSRVFQQASVPRANHPGETADPENRLLWKMNRRRLEFEAMRDSLLAVSGKLDATVGGRPVDLLAEPFTTRRTVYGFIDRQDLPGLFRVFDFASPDVSTPQRPTTTVPQQALFAMNSPFVAEQARAVATLADIKSAATTEDRVRLVYRHVLRRDADADELRMGVEYLTKFDKPTTTAPAWQYGWGIIDEGQKKVTAFHPLAHFAEGMYRGGQKLPDERIGWVLWHNNGGHPGHGTGQSAIRRFSVPDAGAVTLTGKLGHTADQGDGVRARVVSSIRGVLGEWTARKSDTDTPLSRFAVVEGELLDFVVDSVTDENSDGFTWPVRLEFETTDTRQAGGVKQVFDSQADFKGPSAAPTRTDRLERYVQALLATNEFVFVD
jgi:hypothetical protein